MATKISFGLSVKSVQAAIKEIEKYQDSLNLKCEELCRQLGQIGIVTGEGTITSSGFGKHVSFSLQVSPYAAGCKAIILFQNTGVITSEWRTQDGIKTADISPILMLEFGSGLKANNPKAASMGYGTGTFPGQTHATDPSGWWWQGLDNVWHHSSGTEAKMPMYKASRTIREQVLTVAKYVFNS